LWAQVQDLPVGFARHRCVPGASDALFVGPGEEQSHFACAHIGGALEVETGCGREDGLGRCLLQLGQSDSSLGVTVFGCLAQPTLGLRLIMVYILSVYEQASEAVLRYGVSLICHESEPARCFRSGT